MDTSTTIEPYLQATNKTWPAKKETPTNEAENSFTI